MKISKVWIDDGCISCSLCQDLAPDVFLVEDGEDCVVRPDAQAHFTNLEEDIHLAAADCPVDVIRVEHEEAAVS
ncbi:MAG: ferredoxin [Planctomycetes bacterium]|nr:ferredoxin [Planctomycetota bacterium]MCB9916867.1 ferredoxin [Planctomycetota bacterium]